MDNEALLVLFDIYSALEGRPHVAIDRSAAPYAAARPVVINNLIAAGALTYDDPPIQNTIVMTERGRDTVERNAQYLREITGGVWPPR